MIRKKTKKNRKSISAILKKGEFWAGVATVLVFSILVVKMPFKSVAQNVSSYRIQIVRVSPMPTKNTVKVTVPANIAPTQTTVSRTPRSYVIKDGDSYATATQKVCGDEKFYLYNAEFNQNKPLSIGDTIQIRCDWE